MIVAAGLLVVTGLGLFLAGVLTATTAFYWACVAVCMLAAVLLFSARRSLTRAEAADVAEPPGPPVATTDTAFPAWQPASGVPAALPVDGRPSGGRSTDDAGSAEPVVNDPPATGAHAAPAARTPGDVTAEHLTDPPVEEVEVTDLLLVMDLRDEVLVVDEHPRYHVPGCRFLPGRTAVPLPMDEARVDGFTPCALCSPDRTLAERERARRRGARS